MDLEFRMTTHCLNIIRIVGMLQDAIDSRSNPADLKTIKFLLESEVETLQYTLTMVGK